MRIPAILALALLPALALASQALLHAAANRASRGGAAPASTIAGPDWRVYHRTEALLASVRHVASGCDDALVQRVNVTGAGTEISGAASGAASGEEFFVVTLGRGVARRGGGAEWPGVGAEGKLRVLAGFGEHGREFVSSEVALRLVEKVCGGDGVGGDEGRGADERLVEELGRTEMVIVPVVGSASRKLAEAGRYCERGNGRGVDVNRNYAFEWGKADNETLPEEEKPGTAAFSEPETRLMHVLGMHFKPHVYVAVHSGDRTLVVPWDSGRAPAPSNMQDMHFVTNAVKDEHCPECRIGTAGSLFNYRAFGTSVDFMHGVLGVPIAFTVEVFGDNNAKYDDCVRLFNPPSSDYEGIVEAWSSAFTTISVAAHKTSSVRAALGATSPGASGAVALPVVGWARGVAQRLGSASWLLANYAGSIRKDDVSKQELRRRIRDGGASHVESERPKRSDGKLWSVLGGICSLIVFACVVVATKGIVKRKRRKRSLGGSFEKGGSKAV